MIFASRRSVLIFIGFVLLVAIAVGVYARYRISSPLVLDAPPPTVVAEPLDTIPNVPASTIEALVTYNLGTAVDSLEAAVPRTYGDIEQRLPIGSNTRASFGFTVASRLSRSSRPSMTIPVLPRSTCGLPVGRWNWLRPTLIPHVRFSPAA